MKNITSIIQEITFWKNNNPNAFFCHVKCIPKKLQYSIEAITDYSTKEFAIPLGAIMKERVSPSQHKIIRRYLEASSELRQAEEEFIKLFTCDMN